MWGVVEGVARVFGISIDAAVALHKNPKTRGEAKKVVATVRRRIAARRARGEEVRDDAYVWPADWRIEHLGEELRHLAGEGPPQNA